MRRLEVQAGAAGAAGVLPPGRAERPIDRRILFASSMDRSAMADAVVMSCRYAEVYGSGRKVVTAPEVQDLHYTFEQRAEVVVAKSESTLSIPQR